MDVLYLRIGIFARVFGGFVEVVGHADVGGSVRVVRIDRIIDRDAVFSFQVALARPAHSPFAATFGGLELVWQLFLDSRCDIGVGNRRISERVGEEGPEDARSSAAVRIKKFRRLVRCWSCGNGVAGKQ